MRALRFLAMVAGGLAALLVLLFAALQTPTGQRMLAGLVSGKSLQVSGLSGFFPTDLHVDRIELLDTQGPWLRVDNARLRWSFASLFTGRLQVEVLSAALIDVLRPPVPAEEEPAATSGGSFSLPIGIELQALSIDALHLSAAVAEVGSRWRLRGDGLLSADLHEGRVRLSGDRSDGPSGKLSADIRFDLAHGTVDGEVALEEGPGGVVAALLQRPDLDRVSVRLAAKGDAASGSGELTVSAGDAATARGTARWQPSGAGTAVSVQLEAGGARLAALGGPIALSAEATLDAAVATLSTATLTAGPVTLGASGRYERTADRLDATVTMQSGEPGPFSERLAGAHWRDLQLSAHAVLDGLAKQPQGTVTLNGGAQELAVPALDGRLPPLGPVTLDGRLGLRSDGSVVVDSLETKTAIGSVKASDGSYMPGTGAGEAKVTIDLPSLAPLSGLAQQDLTGSAHLELSARNDAQGLAIGWQGTLGNLGTPGMPPGLAGRDVMLSGSAALRRDDTWSLSDVRVVSEAGSFSISGQGQGSTGKLDLALDLRQLAALRPELSGAVTASSTIELKADGAAAGSVTASGDAMNQALSLAGRFERNASGGIVVPSFDFHWASATLSVADLAVTQDRTTGSARLRIERLQDIGALLDTALAGSLEAEVNTDPQSAEGRLHARVHGSGLRSGGIAAGTLQLDATIDDPMGSNTTADATITASGLSGLADIGRINGTVKGSRQDGFNVTLQAAGAQSNANLAAKVELLADEIRVVLSRLEARHQGIPVALNAPTRVVIAGEQVRIEPTTLRLGGGRLALQGVVDPAASDLRLDLAALPLSLVDTLAPGTGIDGTLEAKARIQGALANPRIEATYAASNVRLRRPEAALLPALALQGSASLVDGQASFDARLNAGAGGNLAFKGRMTTAPLAGSVAVTGAIEIAPFAPLAGTQVRNLAGTLRPNLTVEIAGSRITGAGSLDFSNGALSLPDLGLRLSGGTGRLVLQGDTVQIQQLSFQTGRGGTIKASGTVRLDPAEGTALDLAITSQRSLLVNRADLVATVSSDIKVTGSTGTGIDVSGKVTIDRAEIAIGAAQLASFPTIEVREINRPGVPDTPVRPPQRQETEMPIRLDLDVQAPRAVFVRGRGLEAEVGGSFRVTGSPSAPVVIGGLTLRRGDFTLGGRRLVFTRGTVTLDNLDRIDPRLDFLASTTVASTEIQIAITGTPRAPVITVSSSPALPPDEALAWLLFGKPSSTLSATELIQVATTLAELTGNETPASGLLGRLRSGLGLDRLRVGSGGGDTSSGSSSPVSVEAGRYVAPGVYVGARQGAGGNSSRGVVEIEVLDNTKIEGDIGADSRGRVGVKMEWDY